MKLTEEQKHSIRAEEIFRNQVQGELSALRKAGGFWGGLWSFLNSTFGIWFFSSIVFGGVVYFFKYVGERKEDHEYFLEIHEEIRHDIGHFYNAFDSAHSYNSYCDIYKHCLQNPDYEFYQFKDKTMDELLWIFEERQTNEKQGTTLEDTRDVIARTWEVIFTLRPGDDDDQQNPSIPNQKKDEIDKSIRAIFRERILRDLNISDNAPSP